jgi:peptide/nickel transport system substrate-binding protein
MSARAKDLRTAFLLAYPRQEIVETLVKPINSDAVVVNSAFLLPGQEGYNESVKTSGVSKFTAGTQATRAAAALKLIKKYYPSAKAGSDSLTVNMLWGQPSNTRRANEFAIAQYELGQVGINLTNSGGTSGWSGHLDESQYDAQFYAWCPSSVSQTGSNANFKSDGSNNHLGYNSPAMDKILKTLETFQTAAQLKADYAAADKLLVSDAITLSIFQHPAVTAYNGALKNVKPAPLTPNTVWNYWEWKY